MNSPKDMVQALVDMGLTQTKIAADAGVTQPTISRALAGNGVTYENGKKIEEYYDQVRADTKSHEAPPSQEQGAV